MSVGSMAQIPQVIITPTRLPLRLVFFLFSTTSSFLPHNTHIGRRATMSRSVRDTFFLFCSATQSQSHFGSVACCLLRLMNVNLAMCVQIGVQEDQLMNFANLICVWGALFVCFLELVHSFVRVFQPHNFSNQSAHRSGIWDMERFLKSIEVGQVTSWKKEGLEALCG